MRTMRKEVPGCSCKQIYGPFKHPHHDELSGQHLQGETTGQRHAA